MLFKKLLKFDKIIRVGIKISNLLILGKAIMVDSKIYFIDMKKCMLMFSGFDIAN